jgi:hypothetical protein
MAQFLCCRITSDQGIYSVELTLLVSGLCILSVSINLALLFRLRKRLPSKETYEARDLLKDLLNSSAVVEVKVMDMGNFFLRSPRG